MLDKKEARISNLEEYYQMYARSIEDVEGFWGDIAKDFFWKEPWKKVRSFSFKKPVSIRFFEGAKTNITVNAIDRHLDIRGDQVALLWEGNDRETRSLTYRDLHGEVCKFANVLKYLNVRKGDLVTLYLPMVPELAIAMLACARIGAIHSVVFGGFSAESLASRILDADSQVLITADGVMRGEKPVPLKKNADEAMALVEKQGGHISRCVVLRRHGEEKIPVLMQSRRDFWWHTLMQGASALCEPEWVDAEDPLFILYTSGSTGTPKGVLHTVGGYMVYVTSTFRWVFDFHEGDIYWCTADIGWVTGHSYIVYGPLCAGATTLLFEGIPTYPDAGRFWDVVDKYRVTQFYTAPTAIRALMRFGEEPVMGHDLSSLRLLGTVGEPINPEAWSWYYEVIGKKNCPIVDTWWQTETGGILISPLPGATPTKPGSATLPLFGIKPVIVDEKGKILEGEASGILCLEEPWPGMMRTVFRAHSRFEETYFSRFPGLYFTGDGCRRDRDGYFWITGRIDDVINVSGHRIGTSEVESAINSHTLVAESAVVGFPHPIKGQAIYAFVTLKEGGEPTESLRKELKSHVQKAIGALAQLEVIHWAAALPKTRSGKIMRRILRKIAAGEADFGDTTTLADPSVVSSLCASHEGLGKAERS